MTKERIIRGLQEIDSICGQSMDESSSWIGEVIHGAVRLLEQEPCKDAISRQALLDDFGFSEKTRKYGGDHSGYNTMMLYEIQDVIESQPPI